MTHDISNYLNKVMARSNERMSDALSRIGSLIDARLDWDHDSGEEWARFIGGQQEVVLLIHARFPLIFVRVEYSSTLMAALEETEFEIVSVDDFHAVAFSASPEVLNRFADRPVAKSLLPEFSVSDLWYETV